MSNTIDLLKRQQDAKRVKRFLTALFKGDDDRVTAAIRKETKKTK